MRGRFEALAGALLLAAVVVVAATCDTATESGGGDILGELVQEKTADIAADQGGGIDLDSGANVAFGPNVLSADTQVTFGEYRPGGAIAADAVSNAFSVAAGAPLAPIGRYQVTVPYDTEAVPAGSVVVLYTMGEVENEINGEVTQVKQRVGTGVADGGTFSTDVGVLAEFWLELEQQEAADAPVGGADAR